MCILDNEIMKFFLINEENELINQQPQHRVNALLPGWKIHSFLSEVSVCWSCMEK